MKVGALISGGKDSMYAAYLASQEHEIVCLITIKSKNPDSYMFHTPAIELTSLQAEAMELPIVIGETEGKKEEELEDLERVIKEAKKKYDFEGVITGALFSEYQSSRIEKICSKLGLKCISPLWQKSQEELMEDLLENNFEFIFTAVAADGLDKSWLNKMITGDDFEKLKKMKNKIGSNLAGEGGEFESLVLDCPLFKKKLVIEEFEIEEEAEHTARMIIKRARLEGK